MEIQFKEYKNKYGRSHNGTTCSNFLGRSQETPCTDVFHIRLFTKSFNRSIITQPFEEKADKTVKFMQILNSNNKNPWKIDMPRLEVYFHSISNRKGFQKNRSSKHYATHI